MREHLKIRIFGLVQGVYFRRSAKAEAERLGLGGFVQNKDDGTVYLEVEGTRDQLDQFLNWCAQGPSQAKVEKVIFERENLLKGFKDFEAC